MITQDNFGPKTQTSGRIFPVAQKTQRVGTDLKILEPKVYHENICEGLKLHDTREKLWFSFCFS